MNIESSKTHRGFPIYKFKDQHGIACSLQKSKRDISPTIWLGVDFANPQIMASDAPKLGIETNEKTGYIRYPLPPQVGLTTRMHLTQKQVIELLPYLTKFAETGEL